jgi:hypothetical protein
MKPREWSLIATTSKPYKWRVLGPDPVDCSDDVLVREVEEMKHCPKCGKQVRVIQKLGSIICAECRRVLG